MGWFLLPNGRGNGQFIAGIEEFWGLSVWLRHNGGRNGLCLWLVNVPQVGVEEMQWRSTKWRIDGAWHGLVVVER